MTGQLTPRMKSRGFKKIGAFDRSPTHDSATYVRGISSVEVILQLHPYDYPDLGIQIQVSSNSDSVWNQLYSIEEGDIEDLIKMICSDIDSDRIPLD
ncbi:MAG: hypothetical protein R3C03_03335 [Pirellulaceae bacterium]